MLYNFNNTLPVGTKIRVLLQQNSMSLEWNLSGTQWYPRVPLQPVLAAATCHSDSLFGQLSTGRTSMAQLYCSLIKDIFIIFFLICSYHPNLGIKVRCLVRRKSVPFYGKMYIISVVIEQLLKGNNLQYNHYLKCY